MKKNDQFVGVCYDLSHDGLGIVKKNDFVYFVKGILPGEKGLIKVIKLLRNYGVGKLLSLELTSKHRIKPACPVFKSCGGCQYQHIDQDGQQEIKTKRVQDSLERLGACFVGVADTYMMDNPWNYRNKVQVPIGIKKGQVVGGFYKQRTNEIIPFNNCLIQNSYSNKIIARAVELMNKYQIEPYDKINKTGNIKHILTKYSQDKNQIMVVFITYKNKIKYMDQIIKELLSEFDSITTIIQNINQRHDNVILGDKEIILYGDGYIVDKLLGNYYRISLKSFYQVNPRQVEILYQTAIDFASLKPTDIVLDAYCGIGTITLSLAKYVAKVYGVEIVKEAIKDAKTNARMNNINNVDFIVGDAGEYMKELVKMGINLDVVFVDPPRKGCSQVFLEHLITANPKKVIYISCNVATQARDIKILEANGYKAIKCQPVDLFPHTTHVECVVLLQRSNG